MTILHIFANQTEKLREKFLFEDVDEVDALCPLATAEYMRAIAFLAAAHQSLVIAHTHQVAAKEAK